MISARCTHDGGHSSAVGRHARRPAALLVRFGNGSARVLGVSLEIAVYIASRRGLHSISARWAYDGGRFSDRYVLFDEGDRFYDSPAREEEVRAWLGTHLVSPLAEAGVPIQFTLLRYKNELRKPGPAFNYMMASAYEDGADYLYRINDDTQFVGHGWAETAIATLRSYSPPNLGVVGPICDQGNTKILTHDMVHRTHMQIFAHYYPPVFTDWWMDDWITNVGRDL